VTSYRTLEGAGCDARAVADRRSADRGSLPPRAL
jgi:hypothetical protein